MNPFQKNKVDMSALSPEEQKAFRLYGKLPNRKDVMQNKLKERKYFDSGDYALSKAGKTSEISPTDVGREHPVPENIPHLSQSPAGNPQHPGSVGPSGGALSGAGAGSPGALNTHHQYHGSFSGTSGSPVKESSFLQRGESIDDQPGPDGAADTQRGSSSAGGAAERSTSAGGSASPPPNREGVPVPMRGRGGAGAASGSLR